VHAIEIMTTITVTTTADSGAGSLRSAIAQAQGGDTIEFASSLTNKTITLTSGQLDVDKDLIIDGKNAPGLTISGNNTSRVFYLSRNSVDITLRDLIIADGKSNGEGADGAGAGIWTGNETKLTVENSTFKNNHATGFGGGAIFGGWKGTNVITNSTFEGNSSSDNDGDLRSGGAITINSESSLTVVDSKFTDNQGIYGGSISITSGSLSVKGSTFSNNKAFKGGAISNIANSLTVENSIFTSNNSTNYAGAIYTDGASAKDDGKTADKIQIRNSRIENNTGVGQGGALFLYVYGKDQVILENNTIIKNQVIGDDQGIALGGGLRLGNGEATIHNTTFAHNLAQERGGGLYVGEPTSVTIYNSTFYGNRAESADGRDGAGGAMALHNRDYPTQITQTTIANNYAGSRSGGLFVDESNVTLKNALFADNFAYHGGDDKNVDHHTNTVLKDGGGNVQSLEPNPDDTKITDGITLLDPKLGAFTDHGGSVQIPPLPGNPKVTAGAMPILGRGRSPTAPSDLIVTAVSATEIQLTWVDNSKDEKGFKIERSHNQENWTEVATTAANVTRYSDSVTADTKYYYRIRATNNGGNSAAISAQVTTGRETAPPPPPMQEPTLSPTAEEVFLVEADSEVRLQFDLTESNTDSVNEVGIFLVDDQSGSINGITPGEAGYMQVALNQSQVVFSVLPGNQFPDLNLTRQFGVDGSQAIGFYLVKDSTTDTVLAELAAGGTPDNVFFGISAANGNQFDHLQVSKLGNNRYQVGLEDDIDGETPDFEDLVFTFELTDTPPELGTQLQGGQERELIDLRDQVTGMIPAVFGVNSDAEYDNSFGFYTIDDPDGRIGGLLPGDPGYAQAAVSQRLNIEAGLPAGVIVAPFVIADGTPEEFLAENPDNQSDQDVMAYFNFMEANPDGVDHVRLLGDNVFGFEDEWNGGDRDYNDLVVQVSLL